MDGLVAQIERLDSFAKPQEEYRTKTFAGGVLTVLCASIIILLVLSEYREFQTVLWKPELVVDKSRKDRMTIDIDITFPKVPCFALTLDVMDEADEYQNNLESNVIKMKLSPSGELLGEFHENILNRPDDYCGSCYLAAPESSDKEKMCCNSCSAVFGAYEHQGKDAPKMEDIAQCVEEDWPSKIKDHAMEGCRVSGRFSVNKVAGNFHFAPGKSYDAQNYHVHDVRFLEGLHLDFSHTIHHLSFGDHHEQIVNPLDGTSSGASGPEHTYKYHIKVVAAEMHYRSGVMLHTNQFAVTAHESGSRNTRVSFPSVFFNFEISPMIVIYKESKRSWTALLTSICAIVGGVYTIATIVDGILFHAERRLRQKIAIGKAI